MGDMPENLPGVEPGAEDEDVAMLAEGILLGREWMRSTLQKTLAWIEENPGTALICAAGAGFIAGKILLRTPRIVEDED
jgi:hypothetical protein